MLAKINPNHKKPTFSGKAIIPIRELNKVECYIEEVCPSYKDETHWRTVSNLISECLSGDAAIWFRNVEHAIHSWQQFSEVFINTYWTEAIKQRIRQLTLTGRYFSQGEESIMQYFQRKYEYLKYVANGMSEFERIKTISAQLPYNIQSAIIVRGTNTYLDAIQVIRCT